MQPITPAGLPDLTLAVQAGGQSRRMGREKALLPFPDRPLIARVVARLAPLAKTVLITTNHPETLAFLGVPCYPDVMPGQGALGGLLTALEHAPTALVAVVACDMPFASPALFRRAWEYLHRHPEAAAAVPRTARGWQPFHAVYRRDLCLPALKAALNQGERRVARWLETLPPWPVPAEDDDKAFWNLNTPEDYRRALAFLTTGG